MTTDTVITPTAVDGRQPAGTPPPLDLRTLLPLAEGYLTNQSREIALREAVELKQLEAERLRDERQAGLDHEAIEFEKHKFNRQYIAVLLFAVAVLGISAGLIFFRNDTRSGMLILSHVGTAIGALFAGRGWERIRRQPATQDEQE